MRSLPPRRGRVPAVVAAPIASALLLGACADVDGPRPSSSALGVASPPRAASGAPAPRAGSSDPRSLAAPAAAPRSPAASSSCAASGPPALRRAAAGRASSGVELALAADRLVALVIDPDERALHTVDVGTMAELAVTPLRGSPRHVRVLADGRVAVALADASEVAILELAAAGPHVPLAPRCEIAVAPEPWSIAEAPAQLLVASASGALTVLRAEDLAPVRVVPLPREPRAVLVDPGTRTAFVSHAVGGLVSAVDLDRDAPSAAVDLRAGRRVRADGSLDPERRREANQGYALASVEGPRAVEGEGALRIFAPLASVDPGAVDGGGFSGGYGDGIASLPVVASTAVLDPIGKRSITDDVALAAGGRGHDCRLPRGAAADARSLFVACQDLDAVVELDPRAADPSSAEVRRVPVAGGPASIALAASGDVLLVHGELDGALHRISRASGAVTSARLWRRAGVARDEALARGRRLFFSSTDARLSRGRACATCHPDGRDDGLTWSSPEGLRQTPSLAGRLDGTAPFGWRGEHATLEEHLRSTLSRLGGTGLDPRPARADRDALLAFVRSLPAPPGGVPAGDEAAPIAPRVERGREVFVAYGCQGCHPGGGTDGRRHDLGTGAPARPDLDTPSLVGIARTAPYFHDGRHASLEAVVADAGSKMVPYRIPDPDRAALVTYLETL